MGQPPDPSSNVLRTPARTARLVTVWLKRIGYWRNAQHPELPDPAEFVDESWDEEERNTVGDYFARGTIAAAYMGYSPCRVCGKNNGALEFTDGVYVWPEGFAHYIDEHGVRPPAQVVAHARSRMNEIEAVGFDLTWWIAQSQRPG